MDIDDVLKKTDIIDNKAIQKALSNMKAEVPVELDASNPDHVAIYFDGIKENDDVREDMSKAIQKHNLFRYLDNKHIMNEAIRRLDVGEITMDALFNMSLYGHHVFRWICRLPDESFDRLLPYMRSYKWRNTMYRHIELGKKNRCKKYIQDTQERKGGRRKKGELPAIIRNDTIYKSLVKGKNISSRIDLGNIKEDRFNRLYPYWIASGSDYNKSLIMFTPYGHAIPLDDAKTIINIMDRRSLDINNGAAYGRLGKYSWGFQWRNVHSNFRKLNEKYGLQIPMKLAYNTICDRVTYNYIASIRDVISNGHIDSEALRKYLVPLALSSNGNQMLTNTLGLLTVTNKIKTLLKDGVVEYDLVELMKHVRQDSDFFKKITALLDNGNHSILLDVIEVITALEAGQRKEISKAIIASMLKPAEEYIDVVGTMKRYFNNNG